MNIPKIDNREAEDILQEIKELAKQYVPEWNFNEKDPDVGVVFSKIFANMFETTISKYNRMPYNHYISFLNILGVKLLPAISASGMVTVTPVQNSRGVFIDKGTSLYAQVPNAQGRAFYQTKDSMLAINNRINSIFLTDLRNDSINKIYDSKVDEGFKPFRIFDSTAYDNLQSHVIYFVNDDIFNTKDKSNFLLKLIDKQSLSNNDLLPSIFTNKDTVKWQYYKEGHWRNISDVKNEDGVINISFNDSCDDYEIDGKPSKAIRCMFDKLPSETIVLTDILYSAKAKSLVPDALLYDSTSLSKKEFFPFGEQYNIYSDFYISSKEAFLKKGAVININFDMQYIKAKINTAPMPDNTKYKYLMTEMDFQSQDPSDIEIEKVAWEYWNGVGWEKLYEGNENEDFFIAKEGDSRTKTLSFICPDDIDTTVIGPQENYFIRARITKIKNQFNVLGNYITPYINDINMDYKYENDGVKCKTIVVDSNMEKRNIDVSDSTKSEVLKNTLNENPTLYICLDKIIDKGPIRLLIDIETGIFKEAPSLIWQYYAKNKQGYYEWKNLEVMDMTDNLTHSAIVTIIGKNDFHESEFFGEKGYFIRIVNHDNKYLTDKKVSSHPTINGFYFNTIEVVQKEVKVPEYFFIENAQENKICNLSNENISEASVWVNEIDNLSTIEEDDIISSKNENNIIEYSEEGTIESIWIKWEPINNILSAGPDDRVFEIDYNKGKIIFGNGRHGKIPPHQLKESIKIEYSISEGSLGNIDAHAIAGFSDSVPYIKSVDNLKPMVGGVDMETVESSAKRMAGKINGMDRIVTLNDFEYCIKYNDRNINKIKCVPHVNELHEEEIGTISIVVLPIDYMQGYEKFEVLQNRILEFIKLKAPATLINPMKLKIFECMYIEISVNIDLVIDNYNCYQSVYQDVYKKLEEFLNPITGNFDGKGWEIGEIPRKELIYNYLKMTNNVKYIKEVNLFARIVTLDGKKDIDFDELRKQRFAVPVFGEPEINMSID